MRPSFRVAELRPARIDLCTGAATDVASTKASFQHQRSFGRRSQTPVNGTKGCRVQTSGHDPLENHRPLRLLLLLLGRDT